jgi:dTDP-4-dehydrorhamnose reductase
MKLFITGANGQLGQELTLLAKAAGHEVLAYSSKALDITQSDLADLSGVDYLVNCAAYTAVDKAEDEPEKAFAVNAMGVANLAKTCAEYNVPMIHISTDYVFDGTKKAAYLETDTPNPQGVYGGSKLAGEALLQATWDKHIILRVSWVFGRFGNNFVKTITRLSQERDQLKIVADQHGSPTGASHIAKVILALLAHPQLTSHWGIYHYTDAPQTTWYDFAKSFVDPEKCTLVPITTAEYPVKAKRPSNSVLSCDRINKIFGICQCSWQEELQDMYAV